MKEILQDKSMEELAALVAAAGEKPFRARQLMEGLTQGKKLSEIPVSAALRARLTEAFEEEPVRILETLTARDGTKKFLFALADGNIVEGVLMKYKYGNTQCVSTQVGCRMGCKFCASTLGGLVRNLTAGEILGQVLAVNRAEGGTKKERAVTNIVLMGSGEPFDNYENVVRFLRNVTAEEGLGVSARNISLSTCGLVPQMRRFAEEGIPLNLTVSLHAVTDEERARTMPVANAYKIADILDACACYFQKTGRRYIFEYSLIAGENSDLAHAAALAQLLKGRPCHVNLIRLNAVKERHLLAADEKNAQAFFEGACFARDLRYAPPQHGFRHRRRLRTAARKISGRRRCRAPEKLRSRFLGRGAASVKKAPRAQASGAGTPLCGDEATPAVNCAQNIWAAPMQGSRKAAEQVYGKRSRKRKESAASVGERRGNAASRRRGGETAAKE